MKQKGHKPYRMQTNEQPEFLNGKRFATPNQIAAMIDQQIGGWPAAALTLYRFATYAPISDWKRDKNGVLRLKDFVEIEAEMEALRAKGGPDTTYQFADDRGVSLTRGRTFNEEWQIAMTRDDYYVLRLSAHAIQALRADIRKPLIAEIQAQLARMV